MIEYFVNLLDQPGGPSILGLSIIVGIGAIGLGVGIILTKTGLINKE